MRISGDDFEKVMPGQEVVIGAGGKAVDIVLCRNKQENSIITASGKALIPSIGLETTNKVFSEFPVFPLFWRYLQRKKMVVSEINSVRSGDCLLVLADDYLHVKVITAALCNVGTGIIFTTKGTPIDFGKKKIAFSGFSKGNEEVSSIALRLLSDSPHVE